MRAFRYQLKKFEVLMKRRVGINCLLDLESERVVNSNADKKGDGSNRLAKNTNIKEVIAWLKETNTRLQKEDPAGGKILLTYSRLGRSAKWLRRAKQLKEQRESLK